MRAIKTIAHDDDVLVTAKKVRRSLGADDKTFIISHLANCVGLLCVSRTDVGEIYGRRYIKHQINPDRNKSLPNARTHATGVMEHVTNSNILFQTGRLLSEIQLKV